MSYKFWKSIAEENTIIKYEHKHKMQNWRHLTREGASKFIRLFDLLRNMQLEKRNTSKSSCYEKRQTCTQ